ncbi:unnamed protein product [Miscanthus lutarioriparius]|uniref:KIB1-4 beta-propeller domain-containing protein n=1 Tax=Miscanthus lutarioriparius TaxID=422564 RepID=A0A811P174_9POAL|nr:unnamed protein product [Miscanthus lutarioriparius]
MEGRVGSGCFRRDQIGGPKLPCMSRGHRPRCRQRLNESTHAGEPDIMQSPSKIGATSASTTAPAVYGPQGWADLPEGLLHSIVPLLSSFIELLSFAGTCRSWRAAFTSYPSKSTFCTLLPPLVVRPHISVHAHGNELRTCQVLDPANMKSTLSCQIPEETFEKLHFAGSSYGQLICGHGRNCFIVDVFTGAKVLPPQLPFGDNTFFYSGMLTTPLATLNSHLLVCVHLEQGGQCLLDRLIGSDSWSKLQLNLNYAVVQIVEFNGQFIAMDTHPRLYTLSLAPSLPCLVVCSGMLLIVNYNYYLSTSSGAPVNYKAYRLDMSTEPATWVEVVKLENDALFFGDAIWDDSTNPYLEYRRAMYIKLEPFWVYPSMFYLDGQ